MRVGAGQDATEGEAARAPARGLPAVFHVTHWKAGSTWLTRILARCGGERFVKPRLEVAHFLREPIEPGRVYPRVYVTHEEFERVALPVAWRRFVVIRDLRDTLVSAYFSIRRTHPVGELPQLAEDRARLQAMRPDQGLAWMLDHAMVAGSARIQESWLEAGAPVVRYEDLLTDDVRILQRVLIDECEFPLERPAVARIVEGTRFRTLSGGRDRGAEDLASHFRKGVAGDWRNHFDPPLARAFKERWGDLLIAGGYERDRDW